MFRVSIADNSKERRLILAGKLVAPWTAELENVWRDAESQLGGRTLIIDLAEVTQISAEGEKVLLGFLQRGAKVACCGVFNRHLLRELVRRCRTKSLP